MRNEERKIVLLAKLICGVILAPDCELIGVKKALVDKFGLIDLESEVIPFDLTRYYEKELGAGLKRQWLSFKEFIHEENLKSIKHTTIEIERQFSRSDGTRRVNLDPGYVNLSSLVLATTKNYSHRVYLGDGIHAEVTLIYKDHHFVHLDWTYPDYRNNTEFFNRVRNKFKMTVRGLNT
ncbi:MAG: DUF4416 family protein [bacterium]|nr:DUF4416 family protein [bacterium]